MNITYITCKVRISSRKSRKEIIQTLGDTPAILFGYYLEKKSKYYCNFSDEDAAKDLGWEINKVILNRKLLINAGWFHQQLMKSNKATDTLCITTLGKAAVDQMNRAILKV